MCVYSLILVITCFSYQNCSHFWSFRYFFVRFPFYFGSQFTANFQKKRFRNSSTSNNNNDMNTSNNNSNSGKSSRGGGGGGSTVNMHCQSMYTVYLCMHTSYLFMYLHIFLAEKRKTETQIQKNDKWKTK